MLCAGPAKGENERNKQETSQHPQLGRALLPAFQWKVRAALPGSFSERQTLCVTPVGRTAKQGREREKPAELICALSWAQVCVQSVNQSLLWEISISSRRLKLNIHPALHENEQGRNNSGH